jgi:hypothetical protein
MVAKQRQERCQRDHDDWWFDASKGTRYCHTCRLERNRRYRGTERPETKAPAWGMGAGNKKMNSGRGSGYECTWSRSEILKTRGYQ